MFTKTVLISGAGGFLGGALLHQLSQKPSIRVMALTSQPGTLRSGFPYMENLECFSSTQDLDAGIIPLEEVDILIHSAFARTMEVKVLADSLLFTQRLLLKAVEAGVRGIINVSSQSVYGRNKDTPWNEESALDVDSPYALAKYASELITNMARRTGSKRVYTTNLRLASLSGPGLEARLTAKFVRNALQGTPIHLVGGQQVLAFMDVRDAASGILALLDVEPESWKPVYNLGTHCRYTLLEITEMVRTVAQEYTQKPVVIEIDECTAEYDSGMDCTSFFRQTNWQPSHDLESMIRSLFKYYTRSST